MESTKGVKIRTKLWLVAIRKKLLEPNLPKLLAILEITSS